MAEMEHCAEYKVFSQEMLREMIFSNVIDQKENNGLIGNLRLVNKSWLQSVTKVFRKKKQALFKLELTKSNSINGQELVEEKGGKTLDRFVTTIATSPWFGNLITPAFCLNIREEYFRQENLESLINCFEQLGNGLVELEVHFPTNGGTLTSMFPRLTFPLLSILTFNYHENQLQDLNENEQVVEHSSNVTYFIQSILNGAECLKKLTFPFRLFRTDIVPSGFQYVKLPESLTDLDFKWNLTGGHLEILLVTINRLPNLKRLQLLVIHSSYKDEILFKVLHKFRKTLEFLEIHGKVLTVLPRSTTLIRFPVMENLKILNILSSNLELEQDVTCLEKNFPKLQGLYLFVLMPNALREWVEKSKFWSVRAFGLGLCKLNVPQIDPHNCVANLDLEIMQNIKMMVPNIRILELHLRVEQTCGLKFLLMEMRQLLILKLKVFGSRPNLNSDFWDALLIGAPIEFVAGLRASSGFYESVQLKNDNTPSIKMLSELKNLVLDAPYISRDQNHPQQSLISELTFHFAFLKMPKLLNLELLGRFSLPTTLNITQKWVLQQPKRRIRVK